MVRNIILRIPFVRALVPRVSKPLLPLAGRLPRAAGRSLSLTRGRTSIRLIHTSPTRFNSGSASPETPKLPSNASLSQRLKHLIKSYGWYALGVYFLVGVVDFTVAFAAVNILGAEYVSDIAVSVKAFFMSYIPSRPIEPGREGMDNAVASTTASGHEGLYAMLVLAYTLHKTVFLPVRVGLTAGLTPRLVGWLRSRGWAGGAGTKRAVQEMRDKMRESRERR
ncbi:hypothetical protein EUX98_g3259 [Antrodiella citrinella]|uniref:DUF1279 domain-containing protein n=1 Tax=Antrodiella citrinella TaxID=2447956 RepID=A0A4S4MX05_9APHY|nr:hypothetical protein EUX98_g3259 [Antrodiella citrinella]